MAILKDLRDVCSVMDQRFQLFGVTTKYWEEYLRLCQAAGKAVMEDQGIDDPDEAFKLPNDTVLCEKAIAVLEDLKAMEQNR